MPIDGTLPLDSAPVDSAADSRLPPGPANELDVLFVVDNSNSMAEEQVSFAEQLPGFIGGLGDRYPAVHVGVVTTDMGTGGFLVPTCSEPNFGDDGVLRAAGNTALSGCEATYPPFLVYDPATDDPDAFASSLACVASAGTGGCGFEQPLEAMLKAVTPSTVGATGRFDGTFSMGTTGHADLENAGFLGPNADLLLVLLSDEEDCSALDPELFNPSSAIYTGDLNLRCYSYPGAIQPVERYVDGLLAGRDPRRVHYVPIAGIPTYVAGTDYEGILSDPSMQEMIDPDVPTRLRPSCNVAGRGFAFAPRRMVEVGRQLDDRGAAVTIQSVCEADFSPAFDAIDALLR